MNYEEQLALYEKNKALISQTRKLKCENDFELFKETYLSGLTTHKNPSFHGEIGKYLQGKENRLLFIAPRGFAKSTLNSRIYPLWLSLYGKRKDIFLVSATVALAKENLREIRGQIESNEKINEDFGDMKSDKWTEDEIRLANGVYIRGKGRGFQIRGFRPDIIICDDLEDEEVIYSKEQRDKLKHWFNRTLLPALKPEQRVIYVGTKLHRSALICDLQDKDEFLTREWKALTNEKSIWEEYWSTESLKNIRREIGTYAFEAEYQNNPLSLTDQPIKPHYLEAKVEGEAEFACLALDPAISEREGSDYRAIVMLERAEEGFREVISERGRWSVDEQVDKLIELYLRYKDNYSNLRVVIEEVAFQQVLRHVLLERSRARDVYVPVSTAEMGRGDKKRPRDKMTRLLSVVHLFEQQLVEIKNPELKEELLAFPSGDYDDLVDACVHSLYWLMNYRSGFSTLNKMKRKLDGVRPAFFMKQSKSNPGYYTMEQGEEPKPKSNAKFFNLER